jgi:hypothetical protein
MANENDMLHAEVRVGMQVETFLRSDVGRYITERAEMEERMLLDELVDVASNDFHNNRRIRNEIAVLKKIKVWLGEAVTAGINAGMVIRQQDDEFSWDIDPHQQHGDTND